ncbi:hypothetical protein G3578_09985 [Brevibacillus sp. SYP-B805]|uniref:hypothetical protein n=1 Tax=Brevibacillus sp. SYP-B805 TaxID=1578199 RepID=UPI0013EC9AB9|nr:hypothetical protein [Brevibacillus sp. SYP-B805]NGQ95481.1 hypothetical protein [Brevibacillus sp. SYP-B805]
MKLIECLNQLPDEMGLIDLTETGKKVKTVKEIKSELKNPNEDGYELRTNKYNYGKDIKFSIGLIDGPNIYNQA